MVATWEAVGELRRVSQGSNEPIAVDECTWLPDIVYPSSMMVGKWGEGEVLVVVVGGGRRERGLQACRLLGE